MATREQRPYSQSAQIGLSACPTVAQGQPLIKPKSTTCSAESFTFFQVTIRVSWALSDFSVRAETASPFLNAPKAARRFPPELVSLRSAVGRRLSRRAPPDHDSV